ncbi:MAG TPA: extracellular solute-binding protein [Chloroflexota bacterium]|nr:extracellular solute-binding protein [Chloroflexota bacterium]
MSELTRRGFMRLAANGLVAGALGTPLVFAACRPAAPGGGTPAGVSRSALTAGLKLPTHVPFQAPKPDMEPTVSGVPPVYNAYPSGPLKTVPGPIGKGGDVTLTGRFIGPPATPFEQNVAWQEMNKQVGFNLKFNMYPQADYATRLQTLIAGGQLPDIFVQASQASTMQSEPEFMEAQAADLTTFLAGDAIKDYPNLANLPSYAWPTMVFNGKIFGIPRLKGGLAGPNGTSLIAQGKAFDAIGQGSLTFKNTGEFSSALKAVTNARAGVFALGQTGLIAPHWWFAQCFGAPNQWRSVGGKLTRDWETDEYRAALAYFRSLWDMGVVHPETPSGGPTNGFYAGKHVLWPNSFIAFDTTWASSVRQDPDFKPRVITPFSADGSVQPVYHLGLGQTGRTVLRKASPERVKELLGLLNYFVAPFGSQEYLLLYYGVQGADWTYDAQGNPRQTEQGARDVLTTNLWFPFVTPPDALYNPALGDYVKVARQAQVESFALALTNPVAGLYSKTDASQGTALTQRIADTVTGIAYGRDGLSALDEAVRTWRRDGGDQIRAEYEQALQVASG